MPKNGRRVGQAARLSFSGNRARRADTRKWVMDRRERTRHLIELGGLVQKAGLIELTDDDRTVMLGAFLTVADQLRSDNRDQAIILWGRRGT